jgi:hypothetical protein
MAHTDLRSHLLGLVLSFVQQAQACPGVQRIALVGSLATEKRRPKDVDVLVTVEDDVGLAPLAAAGRRLKGAAQSRNSGADIFLVNPAGEYVGRTCHWRNCRPGVRVSCDAVHCGLRPYLHDDLDTVRLDDTLISAPPIELWPTVVRRVRVPEDVETVLLSALESHPIEVRERQGPKDQVGAG